MNYNGTGAIAGTATGAGGMLAMTGADNVLWLALAAFALIAAGVAVKRMIPKREGE